MTEGAKHFSQFIEQAKKDAAEPPVGDWWSVIRATVVTPILKDAAAALRHHGYHGMTLPKNGTGVLLRTGKNERSPHRNLAFTLVGEDVSVTSSEKELEAIWDDREYVTKENVTAKVQQFILQIVGGAFTDTGEDID